MTTRARPWHTHGTCGSGLEPSRTIQPLQPTSVSWVGLNQGFGIKVQHSTRQNVSDILVVVWMFAQLHLVGFMLSFVGGHCIEWEVGREWERIVDQKHASQRHFQEIIICFLFSLVVACLFVVALSCTRTTSLPPPLYLSSVVCLLLFTLILPRPIHNTATMYQQQQAVVRPPLLSPKWTAFLAGGYVDRGSRQ
jgi:hypothetical protein